MNRPVGRVPRALALAAVIAACLAVPGRAEDAARHPPPSPAIPPGSLSAVPLLSAERPKSLPSYATLTPAPAGPTLRAVRAAGRLTCGVSRAELDFTKDDTHGPLLDLAVAVCRAVAAAVLGDPAQAQVLSFLDDAAALQAVRDGQVALFVGATPDITSEQSYGVVFGPIVLHDGEGFLVHARSGVRTLRDLDDKPVCFIAESENEAALQRLRRAAPRFQLFPFEEMGEMEAALTSGRCTAMAADRSWLAAARTGFHAQVADFVLLSETITNDPVAPAIRQDDPQWARIVGWTINALTLAEENGVTEANVDTIEDHGDVELRRLLGRQDGLGRRLGLVDGFARDAIRAVGNYGEMFERTVGGGSAYKLARGEDRLWRDGGLRQALPMR